MWYRMIRNWFYQPDVFEEIQYLQSVHSNLKNELIAVEKRIDYLIKLI